MACSRRQFIGGALGSIAVWPALARAARQDADPGRVFRHGVASGDPLADRVMLWTRVTPRPDATGVLRVTWRVADDERLESA